jgi:hypothetical protein
MYKRKRKIVSNFVGTGRRLIKKNLPDRGLTNVEKHWYSSYICGIVEGLASKLCLHTCALSLYVV